MHSILKIDIYIVKYVICKDPVYQSKRQIIKNCVLTYKVCMTKINNINQATIIIL